MKSLAHLLLLMCIYVRSSMSVLLKSSDCDHTLGCISNQELTVMLTWQPDAGRVHFQMRAYIGTGDVYVAMGLSHDERMGSDSVNECVHMQGTVSVHSSYNTGKSNDRYTDTGLFNTTGYYEDGTIICSFTRMTNASVDGKRHSLRLPWHVMLVWGQVSQVSGVKLQHRFASVSLVRVDFQVVGSYETEQFGVTLVKIHGSVMLIAWIVLTSVGIVVARYFKGLLLESSFLGQKVWFQIHRTVMVFVALLTVTGFVAIFIHAGGYSEASEGAEIFEIVHPILGIMVTALCLLNPILALFRPHPGTPRRSIFNWVHRFIGTGSHVLAVVTLFFGLKLMKSAAPEQMLFIVGGFLVWHVVMEIVFFVLVFGVEKHGRRRDFEVSTTNQEGKDVQQVKPQKVTGLQEVLLMMHCAVAMAATILLLAVFVS